MGKHMEDKWIKQLRKSAEEMEIPESLCPDQIEKKLEGMKRELPAEKRTTPLTFLRRWFSAARSLSASRMLPVLYGMGAAVLLLGCVYAVYRNGLAPGIKEKEAGAADAGLLTAQQAESGAAPGNSDSAENSLDIECAGPEESPEAENREEAERVRKK